MVWLSLSPTYIDPANSPANSGGRREGRPRRRYQALIATPDTVGQEIAAFLLHRVKVGAISPKRRVPSKNYTRNIDTPSRTQPFHSRCTQFTGNPKSTAVVPQQLAPPKIRAASTAWSAKVSPPLSISRLDIGVKVEGRTRGRVGTPRSAGRAPRQLSSSPLRGCPGAASEIMWPVEIKRSLDQSVGFDFNPGSALSVQDDSHRITATRYAATKRDFKSGVNPRCLKGKDRCCPPCRWESCALLRLPEPVRHKNVFLPTHQTAAQKLQLRIFMVSCFMCCFLLGWSTRKPVSRGRRARPTTPQGQGLRVPAGGHQQGQEDAHVRGDGAADGGSARGRVPGGPVRRRAGGKRSETKYFGSWTRE